MAAQLGRRAVFASCCCQAIRRRPEPDDAGHVLGAGSLPSLVTRAQEQRPSDYRCERRARRRLSGVQLMAGDRADRRPAPGRQPAPADGLRGIGVNERAARMGSGAAGRSAASRPSLLFECITVTSAVPPRRSTRGPRRTRHRDDLRPASTRHPAFRGPDIGFVVAGCLTDEMQ